MYVDPITKKLDSERALSVLLRHHLQQEIKHFDVNEEGMLSNTDSDSLAAKLLSVVAARGEEFGIEVSSIDVRGAFPAKLQVPEKLRALEMPPRDENAFGAQLSNGITNIREIDLRLLGGCIDASVFREIEVRGKERV